MPDHERSPNGRGPAGGQSRRKVLQAGLGLAGTALALNAMAAARPAASAIAAAHNVRSRGKPNTTASPSQNGAAVGAAQGPQPAAQSEPSLPTETSAQPAIHMDRPFAQQGAVVPALGELSPQAALQWLEQYWQDVALVGVPVGIGAIIATIVHGRATAKKAIASSFQQALTLFEAPDTESRTIAAQELLYLLSNPRSEAYHQRIFATAVAHFRQRSVEKDDQRESREALADYKMVPVLVFAATAIREQLERKGADVGAARAAQLNAASIHLDGLSLREAELSYVLLQQATFTGSVLSLADLSHADLAGADLSHATLERTTLAHANLSGTKLRGARARNADLRHALLRQTDLTQADLSYANLEAAELGDTAHVAGANIFRATGLTGDMRQKLLALGAIERDSLLT